MTVVQVVRSVVFSKEKLWTKAVLFVGLVVLLKYGNLPPFCMEKFQWCISCASKGFDALARVREGSCEDNENSGKKSCSHLARSTLPGVRGSLLHKVLYEEVSPRGPTPAYVAIVSCSSEAKNEEQESKIAPKIALVSSLARPKPRVPFLGLPYLRHFLRDLWLSFLVLCT